MKLKAVVDTLEGLDATIQALYVKGDDGKFRLDAEGVEDVSGLKSALGKERTARETAEKALKAFDGFDVTEIKALMDRFSNDEEAQLIKAGKLDVVVEKRTEKIKAEFEKQLKAATAAAEAANGKANRWSQRVLDNNIRAAAAKVGIHAHAIDDALLRGRSMFTLDDDGNAVQVKDGTVVLSKDGKSNFAPSEWLESMREAAPHWFPASGSGGGAQQGRQQGSAGKKSVTRSVFDGMPAAEKAAHVKEGGIVVDG